MNRLSLFTRAGLAVGILLSACSSPSTTDDPSGAPPASTAPPKSDGPPKGDAAPDEQADADLAPELISERPYEAKAPSGYDGSRALPLVLALHGRGDSGPSFVKAVGLTDLVETKDVLLAYPDGTNLLGASGWSIATSVQGAPDDVKYLRAVIADMASKYKVDRKRVIVVGLSMGAIMGNLLACEASDKISGVLSFAGSLVESEAKRCAAKRGTSITLVHGTADATVAYNGGSFPLIGNYLSAPDLYAHWAKKGECGAETAVPARDLDSSLSGAETTGGTRSCREGTTVTLLSVKGGAHVISLPKAALADLVQSTLDQARKD